MAFSRTVATTHTKTLIAPSTGSADKVYGSDYVSASSHTATPAVTDATSGGIPYFDSATSEASSALLAQYGVVIGGGAGAAPATQSGLTFGGAAAGTGLAIAAGTATTDVNALNISQTWNAAGVAFTAFKLNATNTSSHASTLLMDLQVGGTSLYKVNKAGYFTAVGGFVGGSDIIGLTVAARGSGLADIYGTTALSIGANTGQRLYLGSAGSSSSGQDMSILSTSDVFIIRNGMAVGFSSNNTSTGTLDSAFSRISAGLIGVGTGAAGSFAGGLKLTDLTINRAATLLTTSVALTDGAGASVGTLTNAPAATNPTKWIGINDNGTTRYIPSW